MARNLFPAGALAILVQMATILPGTAAQDRVRVELVGQGTGPIYTVIVHGDVAYFGKGRQLVAVDAANAATLGASEVLGDDVRSVAVAGTYACIATSNAGLVILDATNPNDQRLVGTYETIGRALGVAVEGTYAYVASEFAGLELIDISDPAAPQGIGWFNSPGQASGVTLVGTYACLADGDVGLNVIDISDPQAPEWIGAYDTSGSAIAVATAGSYAYVADKTAGLQVLDVSSPTRPEWVGSYDTKGEAVAVCVSGAYAYVADSGNGLVVLDVTQPAGPVGVTTYGSTTDSVAVSGTLAYVGRSGYALEILNVTTPKYPKFVARCRMPGAALGVAVAESYAFSVSDYRFNVSDISEPRLPAFVGEYSLYRVNAAAVDVAGSYAYLGNGNHDGFTILNVTDRSKPVPVGSCKAWGSAQDVQVHGVYAYTANVGFRAGQLHVIDVSDPAVPIMVGKYEVPAEAPGLDVVESLAYLAASSEGLKILDVSDPALPKLVGSCDTSGKAYGVVVSGTYAYVADGSAGLAIIDVSNAAEPFVVGGYDTPLEAWGASLVGGYVCLFERDLTYGQYGRLQIIDVSDPATPVRVGRSETIPAPYDLAIDGHHGCVAAAYSGLFTFRLDLVGDADCDWRVTFHDINPFVLALSDPGAYQQQYPDCNLKNADCNDDGQINAADINAFVKFLGGT